MKGIQGRSETICKCLRSVMRVLYVMYRECFIFIIREVIKLMVAWFGLFPGVSVYAFHYNGNWIGYVGVMSLYFCFTLGTCACHGISGLLGLLYSHFSFMIISEYFMHCFKQCFSFGTAGNLLFVFALFFARFESHN